MKTVRTIAVAVDDTCGQSRAVILGNLTAHEAQVEATKIAVTTFLDRNYWYRAVVHFQGTRLAIVQCTKK